MTEGKMKYKLLAIWKILCGWGIIYNVQFERRKSEDGTCDALPLSPGQEKLLITCCRFDDIGVRGIRVGK
jgi:hypothetical protein